MNSLNDHQLACTADINVYVALMYTFMYELIVRKTSVMACTWYK